MTSPLVFIDTETTGLSLADDIWEFAAIRRETDGTETEDHIFIAHDRAKCARLPESFRDDHYDRYRDHRAVTRREACHVFAELFRAEDGVRPHVVGAVPNFDTERIALMVRKEYPLWQPLGWHHHLIDVENLAVGYLAGLRRFDGHECKRGVKTFSVETAFTDALTPPWKSDDLAAALGVTIAESERHTAMGDARWAMRIYDAVMGSGATGEQQ